MQRRKQIQQVTWYDVPFHLMRVWWCAMIVWYDMMLCVYVWLQSLTEFLINDKLNKAFTISNKITKQTAISGATPIAARKSSIGVSRSSIRSGTSSAPLKSTPRHWLWQVFCSAWLSTGNGWRYRPLYCHSYSSTGFRDGARHYLYCGARVYARGAKSTGKNMSWKRCLRGGNFC